MIRKMGVAAALLVGGHANAEFPNWFRNLFDKPAVDYGAWECSFCVIPAPNVPVSAQDPSDLQIFVRTYNNEIHESKNETVHRWIPNSVITICDAQNCLLVKYITATALWLPVVPSTPRGTRSVRVPKTPETSSLPVDVTPIGPAPDYYTGQWNVTVPWYDTHEVTPSVTVVYDGESTTFVGTPVEIPVMVEPDIGSYLEWNADTWGLDEFPYHCY